jgi:PIN domain nuclease of toxin-antitoxin system
MHYVLDACALLAFLRGEEGADKIEKAPGEVVYLLISSKIYGC